jgi:catechol 2,3-dioxygenase-like lactoylglutathione lyase family enzyme
MEHIIAKLLQDFEQGQVSRRQLIQSLALAATAASAVGATPAGAADSKGINAVQLHHVSYLVADYAKTRDFYVGALGMKVSKEDKDHCHLHLGDSFIVARTRPSGASSHVDHIAYTIENWATDKNVKPAVEAALKRKGLPVRKHNGDFYIKDPDGIEVQLTDNILD